jgi:hypothetical protein
MKLTQTGSGGQLFETEFIGDVLGHPVCYLSQFVARK